MLIPPQSPRPSKPPMLELVNITKRFGSFTANENISLKVPPGSFHALLGVI